MSDEATLPDYSEWLTRDRLDAEEAAWATPAAVLGHRRDASRVAAVVRARGLRSVIEVGCGTGRVASMIPADLAYIGLDKNAGCLTRSRLRVPTRAFLRADVREVAARFPELRADVVCCFSVMKHFGLHEWEAVLAAVLRLGRHGVVEAQVAAEDREDVGHGFHHVWVSEARLRRAVAAAGHAVAEVFVIEVIPHQGESWHVVTEARV